MLCYRKILSSSLSVEERLWSLYPPLTNAIVAHFLVWSSLNSRPLNTAVSIRPCSVRINECCVLRSTVTPLLRALPFARPLFFSSKGSTVRCEVCFWLGNLSFRIHMYLSVKKKSLNRAFSGWLIRRTYSAVFWFHQNGDHALANLSAWMRTSSKWEDEEEP